MKELSSGIYNTLKSGSRMHHGITARDFPRTKKDKKLIRILIKSQPSLNTLTISLFQFSSTMADNISNSDDHLLDEDITIVPSTLSPTMFSSQVPQRLGIRSFSMQRADTTSTTNNVTIKSS